MVQTIGLLDTHVWITTHTSPLGFVTLQTPVNQFVDIPESSQVVEQQHGNKSVLDVSNI